MTYSLTIRRYNQYMSFKTKEELEAELRPHFLHSEQHIVDRLVDFTQAKFQNCYAENSYRDYSVCAYKFDD